MIWGSSPPSSWLKIVQGCVVRLRKALGAGAIETTPSGYRLVVPRHEIDAQRFESGLERARSLLADQETERAEHVVTEALALWRGEPLGELHDWDVARIEAERLDDLRRSAEELRVEAAIRSGRHESVLASAQALVREAPTREHRWVLLATAQYHAGRQSEALATLRRAPLGLDGRARPRPVARRGGPRARHPAAGPGHRSGRRPTDAACVTVPTRV